MINLRKKFRKVDIVDHRANIKWRFYKFTNVTIFASLLKDYNPWVVKTVLPESFLKNHNVNCLTSRQPYNDNLWLFRAFALHLHGNDKLEKETSKISNLHLLNFEEKYPSKFQGVHMNDFAKVEDLLQLNNFSYDIDFVDGELIVELVCRTIQKKTAVSSFYVTTITFARPTTSTFIRNFPMQCL